MMPSLRSWPPIRIGIAVFGLMLLGMGGWLLGQHVGVQANPSVNGMCGGADRCLEPTEVSTFVGRAIEPDPGQAVGRHEWDFTGSGSFGTQVACTGSACAQPCGDGTHGDCSATDFSYGDPAFFATANERQVSVGMRGVDTEGAAGVPQTRRVGVAIAYVGPDRGSSGLAVAGLNAGGFTVTWRDVTDVPGSAYTLHIDNLDDGTGDLVPVANDKPSGDSYSVLYTAEPTTDYLVWVAAYYPTPLGSIVRQSLPGDPIVGVPVSTPANAAPTLAVVRSPGNVPPAAAPPHYVLLRQAGNVLTLNVTASDADGDQLAELRVDGLSALPGASFSGFSSPTPGPVTRALTWNLGSPLPAAGDYSITVVARDVVGGTTSLSLVIRVNSNPDTPSALQVNVDDASSGLASGDPSPVALVVDENLADQNLKLTYRHGDPDGDAASTYRINMDTESSFGSPLTWDSGSQALAVNSGSRSANVAYVGPALSYGTDYWWRVQAGDTNGNLSSWGSGRFKLRPTNYAPVLGPLTSPYNVDVGSSLNINLTATDQDIIDGLPQSLTYFVQGGLPSPRMALNPSTGAFTFTPSSGDLAGTPYSVTLCVRDSYSPPAEACAPATINVNLNLPPPTGLNVSFSSPTAGTASWTHSAPGEDGFQLDRTTAPARSNVMSTAADVTNGAFTFNDCDTTAAVGFQVRAFVDPGAGRQFSAAANATANRPGFAAPTGLSVTATGNTSARISWTPGTTGQSGYAVFNGAARLSPDAAAAATTYDVTGLVAGSAYIFRVQPFVTIASCSPSQVLGTSATIGWTQPNPAITLAPPALAFGNVVKDTPSATMNVTLTNSGSVALTGINATIIGADASQFTLLNVPPGSLAVGVNWVAQVQFRPTAYGVKAAQLQVTVPSFGLSATTNLTGTGVPTAPSIASASWDSNQPSRYSAAWTWGPGDPDDFSLQLPLATEQLRVTQGNLRSVSSQLLTQCYMATGTPHMLNLLAYDGGVFSAPVSANLGLRPGWEAMGSPTFSWLSNTSARLSWADPAPDRSRYEVRVWNSAVPPVAIFSATTTDNATAIDLTGLVAGTNYNVTIRPFRTDVDLPGCTNRFVYGTRDSRAYRQPIIDLEVYIQDNPRNEVQLTELDAGGVWAADDLTFPLRIHNNGDPITIVNGTFTDNLDTVIAGHYGPPIDGSLFSVGWPGTLATGADWNTNVQMMVLDTGGAEEVATIRLTAATYGEVLAFPIRLVSLRGDDPGVWREIFATAATNIGDFGNSRAEVLSAARSFCQVDSRANPAKRYQPLLWFSNEPPPSFIAPGTLYRNQSGQFVFGTRPFSTTLPYTSHRAIATPSQGVWTGRGMSAATGNCSNWTATNVGGAGRGNTASLALWSLAFGVDSCGNSTNAVYCVEAEVPPTIQVTSWVGIGGFAVGSAFGGSNWYEKANDLCQVDSTTDDRWEWRALLSDGSGVLPQIVTRAGMTYANPAYQTMFTAAFDNDVPSTVLAASIPDDSERVWTGYAGGFSCNLWSNSGGSGEGTFGDTIVSDSSWLNSGHTSCGVPGRLYCVQQPVPAKRIVVMANSAPGNGSFGNQASIPGATWWEKANSLCQSDSATADSSTWKALLWADPTLPQTVTHADTLYINAAGHRLFTATADNDVPASVGFAPVLGPQSVPIGKAAPGDCANWTVTTGSASFGNAASAANWTSAVTAACNVPMRFYCVEQ